MNRCIICMDYHPMEMACGRTISVSILSLLPSPARIMHAVYSAKPSQMSGHELAEAQDSQESEKP